MQLVCDNSANIVASRLVSWEMDRITAGGNRQKSEISSASCPGAGGMASLTTTRQVCGLLIVPTDMSAASLLKA
jgi:hypothetical protein